MRYMNYIGVKREIDKLGRVCIPKEMRKMFNLDAEVEIQATTEGVLIKNPEYIVIKQVKIKDDSVCKCAIETGVPEGAKKLR